MNKPSYLFFACITSLFFGCATVQKKYVSVTLDPKTDSISSGRASDLKFSCDLVPDLSSENFAYFDFNIQNSSGQWHRISNLKISFPDSSQNANISLVLGAEFDAWYKAQMKKMNIDGLNRAMGSALVAGVGIGLTNLSSNKDVQNIGSILTLGTIAKVGLEAAGTVLDSAKRTTLIPENHLMKEPLLVPPGLFSDRWLLLCSKNLDSSEYATEFYLEYKLEDGRQEKQKIQFRQKYTIPNPIWQRKIFVKQKYYKTDEFGKSTTGF